MLEAPDLEKAAYSVAARITAKSRPVDIQRALVAFAKEILKTAGTKVTDRD